MKKILLILCASVFFTSAATAANKVAFKCEQIKNKAMRSACIADRTEKENFAESEKIKAIEAEKAKEIAAEKEKFAMQEKINELESIISKSKEALAKYYKDPSSASANTPAVSATCTGSNFTSANYNAIVAGMTGTQVNQAMGCKYYSLDFHSDGSYSVYWLWKASYYQRVDFGSCQISGWDLAHIQVNFNSSGVTSGNSFKFSCGQFQL